MSPNPKISTTEHNIANWIAHHVARRFPALADNPIPGVWFTGSSVWSLLYGVPSPSAEAKDWDIFTETELSAIQLVTGMGWNLLPSFPTRDKRHSVREPKVVAHNLPSLSNKLGPDGCAYSDGFCYVTPEGDVDVWVTAEGDAISELRTYPTESHAHCRAAFSFTDGLLILPNERAQFGVARRVESTLGPLELLP